ncbi:MAG: hypothetical protein RLY20_2439 [Verrucomicrobiota bacterium]
MNPNRLEQELREKAWRRALTADERQQLPSLLASQPELLTEWEMDVALSAALAQLPAKPAPSNLAARVLAEIEREDLATAETRKTNGLGWLRSWGWVPRLAVVAGVIAVATFFLHRQPQAKAVQALTVVTKAAPVPAPEDLEDFDSIYSLPPPFPGADEELIALLK